MLSHRALFIGALVVGASSAVHADDWGTVAIVSSTLGNNTNRLCVGAPDATRAGDLGCPTYAPSVTTAGDVSITGNVSANHFIGDGSQLTGIDAGNVDGLGPADRISSSTSHAMVRAFDGGTVSFTTGGVAGTSYLNTAGHWIGPGISLTTAHGISGTNGNFTGNVGIGTASPTSRLHIDGGGIAFQSSSTVGAGLGMLSFDSGTKELSLFNDYATDAASIKFNMSYGTPSTIMTLRRDKVGIGTVTPTAKLDVVGTISATDAVQVGTSSLGCSSVIAGAIRYNSGELQLCNGTNWGSLVGGGGGSSVSPTGAIQFSADGSGAFGGDAANLFWNDANKRLGLGTGSPQSRLHVQSNDDGELARFQRAGGANIPILMVKATEATPIVELEATGAVAPVMAFRTGAQERIRIDTSGNVGIGTTEPSRTLTVNGIGWLSALELEHVTGASSPISVSVDSGVESDPQVGTLTSGKWCTSNGSAVNCTSDEPTGGAGDNLGNHSASQTFVLNGNLISGDGDAEGLTVQSDGSVSFTSIIRVAGSGSEGCTAADIGAIRFNPVTETFQACRP